MNKIRTCPICGKQYYTYPATSRRDNKTKICPDCGVKEALDDFVKFFTPDDNSEDDIYNVWGDFQNE